jgi:long-chain fatty acid transport protein
MKKILLCAGGLVLSFAFVSAAYGGAIDNKTNWSAEYIRTLNRNAATDYADIAAYNPAGTVKLQEGFTVNGSVQFLSKDYENVVNGTSYKSDEPSYIPGVFGVYNKGKWSLYGAFSNYGGGGKVDYSQGDFTTIQIATLYPGVVGQQLTAESHYLGYTLGAAFAINDVFSVSLGARYIDALKELNASVVYGGGALTETFDFEQDGNGWGAILGVNIAPNDALNIAMRYETKTELDLEATVNSGNPLILASFGIINGQETPRDLPATFAFGLSYWLNPKIRLETNYTHYFNGDADWGGEEDLADDGYDIGIALEYIFNDKLKGSIGYMHTKLGLNPEDMLPENPELDANTIGAGIAYAITEQFHTNISIGNSFYEDDSFTSPLGLVEYKKNIFFMALGLEYRF